MKRNLRKFSVVLLSMCLLAGNGAVLAAEAEVETVDDKVYIVTEDVESENKDGISVNVVEEDQDPLNSVIIAGQECIPDEKKNDPLDLLSIEADSVTVTSTEAESLSGVVSDNSQDTKVEICIDGDVTVNMTTGEGDEGPAQGISISDSGDADGYTSLEAENVSVVAEGTGSEATGLQVIALNESKASVYVENVSAKAENSAQGIQAGDSSDASYGYISITAGDVSATATKGSATGISAASYGMYDPETEHKFIGETYIKASGDVTVKSSSGQESEEDGNGTMGIYARSDSGMTQVKVEGDVSVDSDDTMTIGVTAITNATEKALDGYIRSTEIRVGDITVNGRSPESHAAGILAGNNGGSTGVAAGKVKVESGSAAYGIIAAPIVETDEEIGTPGEILVITKDVSVKSGTTATGVEAHSSEGTVKVRTEDITAEGDEEAVGVHSWPSEIERMNEVAALELMGTTELQFGDVTAKGGKEAAGIDVSTTGGGTLTLKAGSLLAEGDDANGLMTGVRGVYDAETKGTLSAEVGDITVKGGSYGVGISAEPDGGTTTITAKNVLVNADDATGIDIDPDEDCDPGTIVQVKANDVTALGKDSAEGISALSRGGDTMVQVGNVYAEADGEGIGIYSEITTDGEKGQSASVTIEAKDVTGKGKDGVGIYVAGDTIKDGKVPDSTINILADGTVAGDDVAIKVMTGLGSASGIEEQYDTDHLNLTVWSAVENENGEIVRAFDELETDTFDKVEAKNEAISEALEARINYIVKVAEAYSGKMSVVSTAKGNTATIGGVDYFTANQGEEVVFSVSLNKDNEVLEGVYYFDGDESTLTVAGNLVKNADGNYVFNMKRGGSMLLGLKVHTHVPAAAVTENSLAATCTTAGGYDTVVYCSECGAELSRTRTVLPATGHTPGEPVVENVTDLGYDVAVYCTVCGAEISREHVSTQPPVPVPPVAPDPVNPAPANLASINPAPQVMSTREVFVLIDENAEVYGVKAADHLPMDVVFELTGKFLEEAHASVVILNIDKILTPAELERFNRLSITDRFMVLLSILNLSGVVKINIGEMSNDARALVADITTRIENMTREERAVLDKQIRDFFQVQTITIDGKTYESISIELDVTIDGKVEKRLYTFYNDQGIWKLYQIKEKKEIQY